MKTINLDFYEIEHDGDAQYVVDDVSDCGGENIKYQINHDEETMSLKCDVNDYDKFMGELIKTNSGDFCTQSRFFKNGKNQTKL